MAEFFNEYGARLWEGTLETLYMTLCATLFAYVLGLPMGVLLTVTKAGGVAPAPRFNAVFGWLVNLLRSLPFIILMFFIIPFTRLLVGTSIGATAALVPLTLSAAPFIARMVEQSLEEIDTGVIEAAQCMGATRWQIVTRVLLVESVPSLLRGLSISLITILGYTAITGSVGAGGLGNLAFRFGYQRYQKPVMYATVLLLILLVATWYLELLYIWKVCRNSKGDDGKGELHTYVIGKASTLLTALLVFGSYGFVLYSNNVVKMKGFSGSWILAVELILALAAYGLIKRMEAKERIRCHEHGLIKEFQKNWVLFLMLIPLCVCSF